METMQAKYNILAAAVSILSLRRVNCPNCVYTVTIGMNNKVTYMDVLSFMVRRLVTLVVREEACSLSLCLLTSCFLSAMPREL